MRKLAWAAIPAPQALASISSSVQLKNAQAGSVWLVSHHQPADAAAYNREGDMGQQGGFARGWQSGHALQMSLPLILALAILAFAAGFHLLWALGGRLGFSVSLPQRPDGVPVIHHRLGRWRPAAAMVAVALIALGALALAAEGQLALPFPSGVMRAVLGIAGFALVLRAILPTPWTGFFKRIRTTRWARYDSFLYSPLALLLGGALLLIALRR
jgi:hypothetical protein